MVWGSAERAGCIRHHLGRCWQAAGLPIGAKGVALKADSFLDGSLEVLNDDKLASTLGTVVLRMLACRAAWPMWHTHGLPGLSPGLLCPAHRPQLRLTLRGWYDVWEALKDTPGKGWDDIKNMSPLNLVFVQKPSPPFVVTLLLLTLLLHCGDCE